MTGKILTAELVGLRCTIVRSSNPSQSGLSGRVVSETRNTLVLDIAGREKVFSKVECTFQFQAPAGLVTVPGSHLVSRPEDRIKKNTQH